MKMTNMKSCESRIDDGTCPCVRGKSLGVSGVQCSNYRRIMKQNAGNKIDPEKRRKHKMNHNKTNAADLTPTYRTSSIKPKLGEIFGRISHQAVY